MVVYLDLAFLLNALADALALYVTACLGGLSVQRRRILGAAVLGGTYGVLCLLPGLGGAGGFFPQMLVAALLARLAFGGGRDLLRRALLFFILSCTIGGALQAAAGVLGVLNWRAFFLVGFLCYGLLSLVFRGNGRHALAGELRRGWVERDGRRANFTALLDTGHTLTDNIGGRPVLILESNGLEKLWAGEEAAILTELALWGPEKCAQRLAESAPGVFRLLPSREVGVSTGLLLCFRVDRFVLENQELGPVTVALSPTPLSDGGGYTALWSGEIKKGEDKNAA